MARDGQLPFALRTRNNGSRLQNRKHRLELIMRTYAYERLLVLGIVLLVAVGASPAVGQVAVPRTLAELKAEVQLRADRKAYPLATLDAREVREALAQLTSLDRDEWAGVWSGIGDRHRTAAQAAEASDRTQAIEQYRAAVDYYMFARFSLANSPGKQRA